MEFPSKWEDVNDIISAMENEIVDILTDNYPKPLPFIATDAFPTTQADFDTLSNKAKMKANEAHSNFAVLVTYMGSNFKEKKGNVYFPFYSFGILLFSNSKSGHQGIHQLIRATENIAYKYHYSIYGDEAKPVRNSVSGYYTGTVTIGKSKAYPEANPVSDLPD
jgi:hypothetical protein